MEQVQRIGGYTVLRRIGRGGYGDVYLAAKDTGSYRKLFALKCLEHRGLDDPQALRTFEKEARLGGWLRHPCIVQTVDSGRTDDYLFLVMEYVDGITLRKVIDDCAQSGRRLPPQVALLIMERVCDALDYAHRFSDPRGKRLGIVHRDVKPSNLMLTRDGEVKVMDFGIARLVLATSADLTETGGIKGSPGYMSPEQVVGDEQVDAASDIFVSGTILYELLTSQRLFNAANAMGRMYQIVHGEIGDALERLEELVPGAGPIVGRALKREPKARWSSAAQMGKALRNLKRSLDPLVDLERFAQAWFGTDPESTDPELPAVSTSSDSLTTYHDPRTVETLPAFTAEQLSDVFDPVQGVRSDDVTGLLRDASTHRSRGETISAVEIYDRILGRDPHHETAWIGRILCALDSGELGTSMTWTNRGMVELPASAAIRALKAVTLARAGAAATADELVSAAVRDEPESVVTTWAAGLVHHLSRSQASWFLNKAERMAEDSADWLLRISRAYRRAGLFEDAERTLLYARDVDDDNPEVWRQLGAVLKDDGRNEEARLAYERLLELRPDDLHARSTLDALNSTSSSRLSFRLRAPWQSD